MAESEISYFEFLKNFIDIRRMAFSTRGTRLVLLENDEGVLIRQSERPGKAMTERGGIQIKTPILEGLTFTDGKGKPLSMQVTTYPHRLDFVTKAGTFLLTFDDPETILVKLPDGACGAHFRINMRSGTADRRGGTFTNTPDERLRMAYTTNRKVIHNQAEQQSDGSWRVELVMAEGKNGALIFNFTPRLGFNRYIPNISNSFYRATQSWIDWFERLPKVQDEYKVPYYYAWWVMRSGLLGTRYFLSREAEASSKMHSTSIWQWDAYFHALAFRHIDRKLAHDQLRILLDHQQPNGMLPDAVHDDGIITTRDTAVEMDVARPPLLAWIAWKLYEVDSDLEFLSEIYEPLVRWNEWWQTYNDLDGDGLVEVLSSPSAEMESDLAAGTTHSLVSPDLNTYLYLQIESLGNIAAVLGEKAAADLWQAKADRLLETMQKALWDNQAGLFWAHQQGRPICVPTPYSLFPLLTGKLGPEVTQQLVAHFTNPDGFWNNYPLPSVALDDPELENETLWRGPSWVSINYLLMEGLDRSGYRHLADELCCHTLDQLLQSMPGPNGNDGPTRSAPIYGWSAALFIELAVRASRRELAPLPED